MRALALSLLSLSVLSFTSCANPEAVQVPVVGIWGDSLVGFSANRSEVALVMPCAAVRFAAPLFIDSTGSFQLQGTLATSMPSMSRAVQLNGQFTRTALNLTVTYTNPVGTFSAVLQPGRTPDFSGFGCAL
jgi:hypothetical protein